MVTRRSLVVSSLLFLVVGAALGYGVRMLTEEPRGLTGTVTVGALLSLTGELSSDGEASKAAVEKAVSDFNNHLKAQKKSWTLAIRIEDTGTDPDTALTKLKELKARGISLVIGPQTSEELKTVKEYADTQSILLISQSSTAPFLAMADDSILRFAPDDRIQGYAIARIMIDDGITHVATVWRGDLWGMELETMAAQYFRNLGGTVEASIRYDPENETNDFKAEAQDLVETVESLTELEGTEKVGVLYIGFSETIRLLNAANQHDVLARVRSYGSDGTALLPQLTQDPTASQFANKTRLLCPMFSGSGGAKTAMVESYLKSNLNREPDTYSLAAYDIVWAIGLAVDLGQTRDADTVKALIPVVLKDYSGALGSIKLNEAGDIAAANYKLWMVKDGKWMSYGTYFSSNDSIKKATP